MLFFEKEPKYIVQTVNCLYGYRSLSSDPVAATKNAKPALRVSLAFFIYLLNFAIGSLLISSGSNAVEVFKPQFFVFNPIGMFKRKFSFHVFVYLLYKAMIIV